MDIIEKSLNDTPYWEMAIGEVQNDTPIAVALHWMTGESHSMSFLFEGFEHPLRAIFLQGAYPSGHELGGYSWYPDDMTFYDKSDSEQAPIIREEAKRLAAFLRELRKQYHGKIAVTGLSQGGDLSLALAVYHPDTIDLAIPCAGRLSEPMRPTTFDAQRRNLPKIEMKQGTADEIVPVESAREAAHWLKSVGFSIHLQEYTDVGHTVTHNMISDIQELLAEL